jgi:hypothetical protein
VVLLVPKCQEPATSRKIQVLTKQIVHSTLTEYCQTNLTLWISSV